jgi:hypothetical protein
MAKLPARLFLIAALYLLLAVDGFQIYAETILAKIREQKLGKY